MSFPPSSPLPYTPHSPSPLGGNRSPTKSPRIDSPTFFAPGSPQGVSLGSCLPTFSVIRHAHFCANNLVNVENKIVARGSTFPNVRRSLGCTDNCYVHIQGETAGPTIAAPQPDLPGFRTALQRVFGNETVDAAEPQALAVLALQMADMSSYHPSAESPVTVSQIPQVPATTQETNEPMELFPSSPPLPESRNEMETQESQEVAMTLENGKNTDNTGLGDSQHAPTPGELDQGRQRTVRFTSPIEIPGTGTGNATVNPSSQTDSTPATRPVLRNPTSSSTTPGPPTQVHEVYQEIGSGEANPYNTAHLMGELSHAPTNGSILHMLTQLEESFAKKLAEMETRVMDSIALSRGNQNSGSWTLPPPRPPPATTRQNTPTPGTSGTTQAVPRNPTGQATAGATTRTPAQSRRQEDKGKAPAVPVQILKRPTPAQSTRDKDSSNPKPPTPSTPAAEPGIKKTWAAISAAGVDMDGFRLVPTRKRKNQDVGPGIGSNNATASAPSTPHARQRRLLIRSVERGRRIGAAGRPPVQIRDAVNSVSRVKFACAEFNRNDDLVLTTLESVPAEPALQDLRAITKALNDIDIFGFSITCDVPSMNIVINSVPLGEDWEAEDWNRDSDNWNELEKEIGEYNPNIRILDRHKWIRSPAALKAEGKEMSSIIVSIEANAWATGETKKATPYLAIYGRSTDTMLFTAGWKQHANFAETGTTLRTTPVTWPTAQPARANRAHTQYGNA
ncbi:hypothetical protein HOY82DRAFT_612231 [Tuber indicum]|nr:hypothetical protein HOY82DRAFT_612231 [Tuber indicum]